MVVGSGGNHDIASSEAPHRQHTSELWKHHLTSMTIRRRLVPVVVLRFETAKKLSHDLRKAPIELHKARTCFPVRGVALLSLEDPSVSVTSPRWSERVKLAPVLIVRESAQGLKAVIADGYHRTCASYHLE